jgi:hypothetical protein
LGDVGGAEDGVQRARFAAVAGEVQASLGLLEVGRQGGDVARVVGCWAVGEGGVCWDGGGEY